MMQVTRTQYGNDDGGNIYYKDKSGKVWSDVATPPTCQMDTREEGTQHPR